MSATPTRVLRSVPIAGLYHDETKTISLLNTVSMEKQGPILAHELTHALQDQNYDLLHWAKAGSKAGKSGEQGDMIDESTTARHAIVEGQAMVVYLDYVLAPFDREEHDLIDPLLDPMADAAESWLTEGIERAMTRFNKGS